MRDEQVDVGRLQPGLLDGGQRGRGERPGGEPIRLLALHPDVVLATGDRLCGRRALRATGGQPDHVGALWFGRHLDAEPATRLIRRRQDHRAGSVTEQDAGVAIRVVQEPGQQFRPDDQDVSCHPGRDIGMRRGIGVYEPGTGGGHIHGIVFRFVFFPCLEGFTVVAKAPATFGTFDRAITKNVFARLCLETHDVRFAAACFHFIE